MNFARDVVEAADPQRLALIARARDGGRREWSFGAVADDASRLAARLHALSPQRADVVLTLVGNRPEWVATMVACFRQGHVVLPCTEQLRPKDLSLRLAVAKPVVVVCDERNRAALAQAGWDGPTVWVPWGQLADDAARAPVELDSADPCLVPFTSGTAGEPKAVVHAQRYLTGQQLQAEHWLDARP